MAPANPAGILRAYPGRGECVGAIGVSGVASHEDEQIAQAGVSALAKNNADLILSRASF